MLDLEPRVQQLENNHNLLVQELHQINKTLNKMEQTLEKFTDIVTKISVLEEKVHSNTSRIKDLEDSQAKGMWAIVGTFLAGLASFIFQMGGK